MDLFLIFLLVQKVHFTSASAIDLRKLLPSRSPSPLPYGSDFLEHDGMEHGGQAFLLRGGMDICSVWATTSFSGVFYVSFDASLIQQFTLASRSKTYLSKHRTKYVFVAVLMFRSSSDCPPPQAYLHFFCCCCNSLSNQAEFSLKTHLFQF